TKERSEPGVEAKVLDHWIQDFLRLHDLELILQEVRIVEAVARGLEKLHLALGFFDADLGGREVPARQERRDRDRGQHHQKYDQRDECFSQSYDLQEVRQRCAI